MIIKFYKTPSGRSPIKDFIDGLSKNDQATFVDVINGISQWGISFSEVTFRQLVGKLWEVKFSSEGGKYRVAYILIESELMIWLHAFKKTSQKTHKRDLEIAIKRMKEVL